MEDALRSDRLSCYGYDKPTTPNLNRLAQEGVLFEQTIAVSAHTFPPVVSMLTGWWTFTHGLVEAQHYTPWKRGDIWRGLTLPLQVLARAGWLVDGEMVTRWAPIGFDRDTANLESFLEAHRHRPWFFFAAPYSTHLPYNPPHEYYQRFVDRNFRPDADTLRRMEVVRHEMIIHPPGLCSLHESGLGDHIGRGEGAHRRTAASVRFNPADRPGISALYDGEVRVFDDLVGSWVRKLEELDLLEDTLIVVTSDHGEELLDRGHVGHSSCSLMGTLYDEILKVPLILRYPKRLPRGVSIKRQVSQVDIIPTLFDLLRLKMPYTADGKSLLPLIERPNTEFRPEAYAQTPVAGWQALPDDGRQISCVRTKDWKLIVRRHEPELSELYNLGRDPGETDNVIAEYPSQRRQLLEMIEAAHRSRSTSSMETSLEH
jgi:arylsulfatase A-like enzyme